MTKKSTSKLNSHPGTFINKINGSMNGNTPSNIMNNVNWLQFNGGDLDNDFDGVGFDKGYLDSLKDSNKDLSKNVSRDLHSMHRNKNKSLESGGKFMQMSDTNGMHTSTNDSNREKVITEISNDNPNFDSNYDSHNITTDKSTDHSTFIINNTSNVGIERRDIFIEQLQSEARNETASEEINSETSSSYEFHRESVESTEIESTHQFITVNAESIFPSETQFLDEYKNFSIALFDTDDSREIPSIHVNGNTSEHKINLDNRNDDTNSMHHDDQEQTNDQDNSASLSLKDTLMRTINAKVMTEFDKSVPCQLKHINVAELLKNGHVIKKIDRIEGDGQYGIAKLTINNDYMQTKQINLCFSLDDSELLSNLKVAVDHKSDRVWKRFPSQQVVRCGKLYATINCKKSSFDSNDKLRLNIFKDDELSCTIYSNIHNHPLDWQTLTSTTCFDIGNIAPSTLKVEIISMSDLRPYTHYFQSGAKLKLSFALDFSQSAKDLISQKERVRKYECAINSITKQFLPYLSKNSQIFIDAAGVPTYNAEIQSLHVNELNTDITLNVVSGCESLTFSRTIQKAVGKVNEETTNNTSNYSVLIILTENYESQMQNTYNCLVQASKIPLSIIFVCLDEDALQIEDIRREIVRGTRMTSSGYLPINRQFCEIFDYSRSQLDKSEIKYMQQEIFKTILLHLEDYMKVFKIQPILEAEKVSEELVEVMKKEITLYKPKVEVPPESISSLGISQDQSSYNGVPQMGFQGIPNFQMPPPMMFQSGMHWNVPMPQPMAQIPVGHISQGQPQGSGHTVPPQNIGTTDYMQGSTKGSMESMDQISQYNQGNMNQSQYFMSQHTIQHMLHNPSMMSMMQHPSQAYGISPPPPPSNFVPYPSATTPPFIPFQPLFPNHEYNLQSMQPIPSMQPVPPVPQPQYDQSMEYSQQSRAYQGQNGNNQQFIRL